jgi:hypothetical protein
MVLLRELEPHCICSVAFLFVLAYSRWFRASTDLTDEISDLLSLYKPIRPSTRLSVSSCFFSSLEKPSSTFFSSLCALACTASKLRLVDCMNLVTVMVKKFMLRANLATVFLNGSVVDFECRPLDIDLLIKDSSTHCKESCVKKSLNNPPTRLGLTRSRYSGRLAGSYLTKAATEPVPLQLGCRTNVAS